MSLISDYPWLVGGSWEKWSYTNTMKKNGQRIGSRKKGGVYRGEERRDGGTLREIEGMKKREREDET